MAGTNSPEIQAKHDVQDFNKKGADQNVGIQNIVEHAHSMQMKDLKSEQNYWNTVSKSSHDTLPGLTIHKNSDGNVDSVKQGDKSIFDRNEEVKNAAEKFSGGLKKGQGPFQAFKDEGMSDREASTAAKTVMERTGRHDFKAGEKISIGKDESVTTSTEHNHVTTEEKYNKDKTHETKVTQPNGDYTTSFKDANGEKTGSLDHKTLNGTSFDTKSDKDGKVTEKSQIDPDGTKTVSKMNGDKPTETTVTKDGVATTTKFQENGTTPTETTVVKDGKTFTTKFAADGKTQTETVEKGTDGLATTTKYAADGKTKTEERKEKADGYFDTKFKNGQPDITTDHTNGPNGAWKEHVNYLDKDPTKRYDSVREQGPTGPDGKFHYTQTDHQYQRTTTYDINFEKGGQNGVGTRSIQGSRGTAHTNTEYVVNGQYTDKAPKPTS
ncbi:MAG: hypothetical protein P4L53_06320 [Candidatus Obscuribacterales bacterium]|nr:hypothetical protein [Candidatus Obscuribacterales bacterium]